MDSIQYYSKYRSKVGENNCGLIKVKYLSYCFVAQLACISVIVEIISAQNSTVRECNYIQCRLFVH